MADDNHHQNSSDQAENTNSHRFCGLNQEQRHDIAVATALRIGFQGEIAEYRFEDGPCDEIIKRVIIRRRSMLLSGNIGVGKTGLLSAAYKTYVARYACVFEGQPERVPLMFGLKAICVTWEEVLKSTLALVRDIEPEFDLEELFYIDLLIIDDFCDTPESDYQFKYISELIRYRYQNRKQTWIASNVAGPKLAKRQGWERLYTLLADPSWMTYIEVQGKNRRKGETK